jgi:hypothetical protein
MPLVVPGLMSKDGGSSGDDWMSKLMGKKLGEQHDEMVRGGLSPFLFYLHLVFPHLYISPNHPSYLACPPIMMMKLC